LTSLNALLRNKHFKKKIKELGLNKAGCRVCCIWNFLFRHSTSFMRNVASIARKKLDLTQGSNIIFVDLSFPIQNLPKRQLMEQVEKVFGCVRRVSDVVHNPICIVASNNYLLLEEVPKLYPTAKTLSGLFFTRERYQLELQQHQSSQLSNSGAGLTIPKTEHNALIYFFMGYYLQLNSTVLFTGKRSVYSESMAAYREFHYPSGRYVVARGRDCRLEKFRK